MPHVNWNLPEHLREKFYDRVRTKEITADDLLRLTEWLATNPEVPEGDWCKDFGTFKLVGHGPRPSTLLAKHQPCWGERL